MRKFRSKHPKRTYTGSVKTDYKDYREHLRRDFNGRCGYTDCLDVWWGDGFNVDHFAPKKPNVQDPAKFQKFAEKINIYKNLIYACPQVNRAKGNDWPSDDPEVNILGDKGYLDPCEVDFNDYFERTNSGWIVPQNNPIAKYMWTKLKLYLKRYEIYWRIEQIIINMQKLQSYRKKLNLPEDIKNEINEGIADLNAEYLKYLEYLQINYLTFIR